MIQDETALAARVREIRNMVRASWVPAEEEVERTAEIPRAIHEGMKAAGLFGLATPPEFDGEGMSCEELAHINIEISQCSVAFRTRIANNIGVPVNCLLKGATEAQKKAYLPRAARGELLFGVGVTEKEFGSEATAMQTSATRDGDSWLLNGEKAFITNGPIADLFVIFARTGTIDARAGGITGFLIDKGTPGFSASKPYRMMGQRGAPFSSLILENCRVSDEQVLGGEINTGFATLWHAFRFQRIQLAAFSIGPAIRLVEEALRWVRERRQFGKPIGQHQLVQAKLADCQIEITTATALVLDTARRFDAGEDITMEASICKYFATEMACRVADRVVQLFGARGYTADYSCVERFYRDLRGGRLAEGSSEIHQLTIAREMLKRFG